MTIINSEWKSVHIGDLGDVVTGGTPSSKKPKFFGDLYPFITPTDMDDSLRYIETARFLSDDGRQNQIRKQLPAGAVCFVCIGATIGKACMTHSPSFTNQQINSVVVDSERQDSRFVYYLLSTLKERISGIAAGAATPIVNKSSFSDVEVSVPSKETQGRIAGILSAYDDLIENNLRRIKILEEMAQNLYREWFVKFRFPGHEQVCMLNSPVGKIPEEWEVVKVEGLLKKIKRKKKIKKQDYQLEGEIPVVDQGKDFVGGFTSDVDALHDEPLPIIVFGDHTRILKFIDFAFACGADGTQLLRSNTNRMPMSLFYSVLESIDLSSFAYARHFKYLKEQEVLLPDEPTAQRYSSFVNPLRDQIRSLMRKNSNLRQTRDLLLPKLISGELDVSELDIDIGEAA